MKLVFFILFAVIIGQSAIDIYLPSMPGMVHELHTTSTAIQLSLTAFLIGFAVSQLIYGALSDRYGRKPVLLLGLSIFLIGSVGCVFSSTIQIFFIFRLLQGLGVGAASTMSRAIARDSFEGKDLSRISAYTAMAWATVPVLAPLLGSYIQTYLGWRYNFVFLILFALSFIIAIVIALPETFPEHKRNLQNSALTNYKYLLTHKVFLKYILCVMLLYGMLVNFNVAAPFLIQTLFHQSVVAYGWWIVLITAAYFLGSFTSSRLIRYVSSDRLMIVGSCSLVLVSVVMFLLAMGGTWHSPWVIVIPMFFVMFSIALMYPQCIAGSLHPFPEIAGSAGALFGFMVFIGGTLASMVMSHLPEHSIMPLAAMILIQSILLCVIYYFL